MSTYARRVGIFTRWQLCNTTPLLPADAPTGPRPKPAGVLLSIIILLVRCTQKRVRKPRPDNLPRGTNDKVCALSEMLLQVRQPLSITYNLHERRMQWAWISSYILPRYSLHTAVRLFSGVTSGSRGSNSRVLRSINASALLVLRVLEKKKRGMRLFWSCDG